MTNINSTKEAAFSALSAADHTAVTRSYAGVLAGLSNSGVSFPRYISICEYQGDFWVDEAFDRSPENAVALIEKLDEEPALGQGEDGEDISGDEVMAAFEQELRESVAAADWS